MKSELSDAIARLTAQTIAAGQEPYRSAAKLAHGLPVSADIGGTTVITPDGAIFDVALDEDRVRPVTEAKWKRAALAMAARLYPELAELYPQRPRGAVTCDACAGTGVFIGLPCGHCGSVGWIDA